MNSTSPAVAIDVARNRLFACFKELGIDARTVHIPPMIINGGGSDRSGGTGLSAGYSAARIIGRHSTRQ